MAAAVELGCESVCERLQAARRQMLLIPGAALCTCAEPLLVPSPLFRAW